MPGKHNEQLKCAVITGDFIASSKLAPKDWDRLHTVMKQTSRLLRESFKGIVPLDVDIFRGDSWQMLVIDPAKALRLSLFYRATIRAKTAIPNLDTRMAVAVGDIDSIPKTRVSEGHGEAYILSGEALDRLNKSKTANMCFDHKNDEIAETFDTIVRLMDAIATRWTDKQALAISGALRGMKQEEIAEKLWEKRVTQQAVAQHLSRAGWDAVEKGIEYFEKRLKNNLHGL
ncbi:MAG: hypothetical protein WBC70_15165 [Candidatus Aminicenantales bacterium]